MLLPMNITTEQAQALYTSLHRLLEAVTSNRITDTRNPYSYPEVQQGLKTIAEIRGMKDIDHNCRWLDALDD